MVFGRISGRFQSSTSKIMSLTPACSNYKTVVILYALVFHECVWNKEFMAEILHRFEEELNGIWP